MQNKFSTVCFVKKGDENEWPLKGLNLNVEVLVLTLILLPVMWWEKRDFIIEKQIAQHFEQYS